MKGLLPNEFPFSRKRKPARRKVTVRPQAARNAAPDVATLSVAIANPAPQSETVAAPVTIAETAPVIAVAAEAASVVQRAPAVAVEVQAAAVAAPAAPVAVTAAVAAPVAPVTPAIAAPSATTHQDPRRATSRASLTPATST